MTPNIYTEVSNLSRHISEPAKTKIANTLREFTLTRTDVEERYIASRNAMSREEFIRLGLTDAGLLELAAQKAMILTTDLGLYLAALNAGYQATNFNYLRDL